MTTAREPITYSFDHTSSGGYSVSIYPIPDERRERAEKAILAAGVMLPLPHRCSWARAICPHGSLFFAVEDENGADLFGFAAKIVRRRALPAHIQLRVEMFGGTLRTDVLEVALKSLKEYAASNRKVLRVNVEVMSRDRLVRSVIGQYAKALGFCRREKSRSYNRTVVMDLTRDESAIFASLHPTARRHIRITSKKPLAMREIVDTSYSHRCGGGESNTRGGSDASASTPVFLGSGDLSAWVSVLRRRGREWCGFFWIRRQDHTEPGLARPSPIAGGNVRRHAADRCPGSGIDESQGICSK